MALSEKHQAWLQDRGIDLECASRLGVHSVIAVAGQNTIPDSRGNVLAFPYIENGILVAQKYRGAGKRFWQMEGGKKTFYNADVLHDPALIDGTAALVITEGELDCLAVMSAGRPFCVSVPDGAPAVPDGVEPEEIGDGDLQAEATGRFAFLWNNRERLQKIRHFVIATDSDGPGRRLAAALVKHLGAARCKRLEYTDGCKDPNEILTKFGAKALSEAIDRAKPYPLRGVYEITDFPDENTPLFDIGMEGWSDRLKLFPGAFVVVTGPTSHGKTAFTMEVAANMAMYHRWKAAVFSPEQRPVEIRNQFRTLYLGGQEWTRETVNEADGWIRRHFKLIFGDPVAVGSRDEDITLQWLLDRAEDAVLRYDIDLLLIDPWNELEHARDQGESVTDYTGRAIRQIKKFARQYNVAVMLCVHPTKDFMRTKDGKPRAVTLYDADGSAHWANKADIGIVVERDESKPNGATLTVAKLRYRKWGKTGAYQAHFDAHRQRYEDRTTL